MSTTIIIQNAFVPLYLSAEHYAVSPNFSWYSPLDMQDTWYHHLTLDRDAGVFEACSSCA